MTALVRAELRQLRNTRSTWALLAVALLLCLTVTAMVLARVGGIDAPPRGSTELRDTLLGASGAGMLPVLLLGVLAVTGEFHHRTATSAFLAVPDRRRVVAAKAVACALLAPVVAVGLMIVPLTIGTLSGVIELSLDERFARLLGGELLMFACWAVLGVGVGAVVRNQTVAVVVPLLWFGVVETLVPAQPALLWLHPWLPGPLTGAIGGDDSPGALSAWAALVVFLAYTLILLLAGTRRIVRLDVT
jgi:ABC-type transport system involved in multi-copper enzyme maturation permease subunit